LANSLIERLRKREKKERYSNRITKGISPTGTLPGKNKANNANLLSNAPIIRFPIKHPKDISIVKERCPDRVNAKGSMPNKLA
jgi:hypothetical protein